MFNMLYPGEIFLAELILVQLINIIFVVFMFL